MKFKFETKVWAAFTVALAMIVAVAIGAYRSSSRQRLATGWVEYTYRTILQMETILGSMVDIQTGVRGYLLTGDSQFLDPYYSGSASIGYEIAVLRQLISNNPSQLARLDSISVLVAAKLDQAKLEIDFRRSSKGIDDSLKQLVRLGQARVQEIRELLEEMTNIESGLLSERLSHEAAENRQQILLIILGNLAALVFITISAASIYRQIRRRREAEIRLHNGLSFLDSLIENIPHMIFVKDAKTLKFVRLNRAGEELLGMKKEELLGKSDYDFFPKEQADFFTTYDRQVLDTGELLDVPEEQIDTRHFGKRTLHTKKIPIMGPDRIPLYLLGISEDITERQKAETMISRFFDLSLDMLCIASQDGYFVRVNPSWNRVLGYTSEELTEKQFVEYVHPDDRDATITEMSKLARGEIVYGFENRYRCKDGSYRTMMWNSAPALDSGLIYAVAHDITDQKATEKILFNLNKELQDYAIGLEASNTELEAFSYSVSHDLRAPLRSIDGFCQALLNDYAPILDATGQDYLRRVRVAAQRMSSLIDDLLQLSRITRSELTMRETDLSALAREIAQELQEQMPAREATFKIQDNLRTNGDPRLLRVALENLLGNAWKYSSHEQKTHIEFGLILDKPGPAYYVRDNGVGFDMAYADKLFRVFERLHSVQEFEGTGVGLASVDRIIRRHGGEIWAESTVGEGATFYFTIGSMGKEGDVHEQRQNDSAGRGQSGRRRTDLTSA